MLLDKIIYADDFPMNITIARCKEDPRHYHIDLEFIYVLCGEIQLKNGYCDYTLREGDIFINAGHEVHSLTAASSDNVIASIQINTHYFSQYFPELAQTFYRTYSKGPGDKKLERLQSLLLQILLKFTTKSFGYKRECVSLMVDTIKLLNKYFTLFALRKDMIVGFDKGNQVAAERIKRVMMYVYQHYADKITLKDLSEREHLSTFYLAHLIKDYTGMSFRDCLCLARVEWSEIRLLESDSKISRIAMEVGFSTTAYYKQYFEMWFKCSPQEYRRVNQPLIKSDLRPAVLEFLPRAQMVSLIKDIYTRHGLTQDDGTVIASRSLEIDVDLGRPPLFPFDKKLTVKITLDDYTALGIGLPGILSELAPDRVVLMKRDKDPGKALTALVKLLQSWHFTVELGPPETPGPTSAVYDSIAHAIQLVKQHTLSAQPHMELFLRDTGPADHVLQGQPAVITAAGLRKPSFYACQLLSTTKGSVIYRSNQCCVIRRMESGLPVLVVLACNDNNTMLRMYQKRHLPREVKCVLNDFVDILNVGINVDFTPGVYSVVKYSLDKDNNIFAYMSALDFQDDALLHHRLPQFSGAPAVETYLEDVRTHLNLNCAIKGPGLQMVTIKAIKEFR